MTIVNAVHLLGSILAFGVGFVYCLLQTIMSYKMNDEMPGNSLCIRRFRVVICVIDAILLIIRILLIKESDIFRYSAVFCFVFFF